MKKNEFIELVKDMEDEVDIDETILSQGFAKPITDMEGLKQLLASNGEIKGYYQSAIDSGIGKGVATFRDNFMKDELPKLIDEGIKAKSDEGLTEEQKQIRELIAYKEQKEKEEKINGIKKGYKDIFAEKKLSTDLMDFINFNGEKENIDSAIEKLSKIFGDSVNTEVKNRIGDKDETPPKDSSDNLTLEEQIAQAMGIK